MRAMYKTLEELYEIEEDGMPRESDIEKSYKDVTLVYCVRPGPQYATIFDTSRYEKNNLIGLTYVVPPQYYRKLASDVAEGVRNKMKEHLEDDDMDWLKNSVQETMDGVVVPHCDIYRLKNGRWVWRSKFEYTDS